MRGIIFLLLILNTWNINTARKKARYSVSLKCTEKTEHYKKYRVLGFSCCFIVFSTLVYQYMVSHCLFTSHRYYNSANTVAGVILSTTRWPWRATMLLIQRNPLVHRCTVKKQLPHSIPFHFIHLWYHIIFKMKVYLFSSFNRVISILKSCWISDS